MLNDRLSTMICDACVTQINTINHLSGISKRTNELMVKLLKKKDLVRKLFHLLNKNSYIVNIFLFSNFFVSLLIIQ